MSYVKYLLGLSAILGLAAYGYTARSTSVLRFVLMTPDNGAPLKPWIELRRLKHAQGHDVVQAIVMLAGIPLGVGECHDIGIYKQEAITEKTAIALAQFDFQRNFLAQCAKDVRRVG